MKHLLSQTNLLPVPIPGFSENTVLDITSYFQETAPCQFEATLHTEAFLSDAQDIHTFLRFSRTGCRAALHISDADGHVLSFTHYGTYTDWECDISELLRTPTFPLRITLQLKADERTLSPYQKAGIFGNIRLIQVPSLYFSDFYVRSVYQENAWSFDISCPLSGTLCSDSISIEARIETLNGLCISAQSLPVSSDSHCHFILSVPDAHAWSPDTPYLYRITLLLKDHDRIIECCEKEAGLCLIEKNKQQILLNGQPLKLRGLAYREPLSDENFDPSNDLKLFSEANINYLRSLYYPFSERFLSLCDQAGILVEQSAPVDGVGQSLPANQNAPALRPLFLSQYQEMVLRDRSHPSILLWSLGNESVWGDQFYQGLHLIKSLDGDRLVNFHLPMTIPQDDWVPDVWSMQHGAWNLESDVCYDQMVIFHTHGADNPVGYAVGKAQDYHIPVLHDAYALVPVYDRDALDKEDGIHEFWGESLSRFWNNIRNTKGALGGAVMAAVDETGFFHPSLKDYCYGILDANHQPKPEYWHVKMAYQEDPFTITDAPKQTVIENSKIRCTINPSTGLLSGLWLNGRQLLCSCPFLHTGRFRLDPWHLTSLEIESLPKGISLTIRGSYGNVCDVSFFIHLTEYGELFTTCRLESLNRPMPHTVKSGIGLDPGGVAEFGIRYLLPSDIDTLQWSRNALWSQYPDTHIGRPRGIASRNNSSDFCSLKANLTEASVSSASGTIRLNPLSGQSIRLALSADRRCVLDDREDGNALANISWDGSWYLVNDKAGLVNDTETMAHEKNASCTIRFNGTGLTIYGTTDRIRGLCNLWIDGKHHAKGISQHTPAVQFPAMSRGYEKRYHVILFSIDSLAPGDHVCRVVVTGEKEPVSQETWISIDSVEVIHPDYPKQVSMIICQDYNYPRLTQGNYMHPAVIIKPQDEAICNLYFEENGGM